MGVGIKEGKYVVIPQNSFELTDDEKKEALEAVNLKTKRGTVTSKVEVALRAPGIRAIERIQKLSHPQ